MPHLTETITGCVGLLNVRCFCQVQIVHAPQVGRSVFVQLHYSCAPQVGGGVGAAGAQAAAGGGWRPPNPQPGPQPPVDLLVQFPRRTLVRHLRSACAPPRRLCKSISRSKGWFPDRQGFEYCGGAGSSRAAHSSASLAARLLRRADSAFYHVHLRLRRVYIS